MALRALLPALLTPAVLTAQAGGAIADHVLTGGQVVTVDEDFTIAEAVAIKDGKIARVGTSAFVSELIGAATEVIELEGRTVVPGFIDGHAHMDREGLKFLHPDLSGARSVAAIVETIRREAASKAPGEWIVTMPIGDYPFYFDAESPSFLTEGRFPTRHDLDEAAPDNPVYIKAGWYYWRSKTPLVSVANTAALRAAGITRDTTSPHESIEIARDASTGEPTGVFLEHGGFGTIEFNLMKAVPRFTHEDRVRALRLGMKRYLAVGTTSVYEGHGVSASTIRAYRELWEMGELIVRSYLVHSPSWDAVPEAELDEFFEQWLPHLSGHGFGDEMLKLGGIWTDVGTNPMTELRKRGRPYTGWAGQAVDANLHPERGTFFELVLAAARARVRANMLWYVPNVLTRQLDALERVDAEVSIADQRFVVEHLTFVTDAQQERIKQLGLVATVLPNGNIWKSGGALTEGASASKLETFVPLRSFIDKGIPFAIASDNKPIEPLVALWSAVARSARENGEVLAPSQRITRAEALRALTMGGAYLSFEEDIKGSIEAGKLADLAVLSDDVLRCAVDAIPEIDVVLTMVGGKVVHRLER